MGEIVNLRRIKKTRARDEAARLAAENRARHGLSKAEQAAQTKRRDGAEKHLDHARLEDEPK